MEVRLGDVDGAIERVDEGGVEGPKGELVDYVGEVEAWKKESSEMLARTTSC